MSLRFPTGVCVNQNGGISIRGQADNVPPQHGSFAPNNQTTIHEVRQNQHHIPTGIGGWHARGFTMVPLPQQMVFPQYGAQPQPVQQSNQVGAQSVQTHQQDIWAIQQSLAGRAVVYDTSGTNVRPQDGRHVRFTFRPSPQTILSANQNANHGGGIQGLNMHSTVHGTTTQTVLAAQQSPLIPVGQQLTMIPEDASIDVDVMTAGLQRRLNHRNNRSHTVVSQGPNTIATTGQSSQQTTQSQTTDRDDAAVREQQAGGHGAQGSGTRHKARTAVHGTSATPHLMSRDDSQLMFTRQQEQIAKTTILDNQESNSSTEDGDNSEYGNMSAGDSVSSDQGVLNDMEMTTTPGGLRGPRAPLQTTDQNDAVAPQQQTGNALLEDTIPRGTQLPNTAPRQTAPERVEKRAAQLDAGKSGTQTKTSRSFVPTSGGASHRNVMQSMLDAPEIDSDDSDSDDVINQNALQKMLSWASRKFRRSKTQTAKQSKDVNSTEKSEMEIVARQRFLMENLSQHPKVAHYQAVLGQLNLVDVDEAGGFTPSSDDEERSFGVRPNNQNGVLDTHVRQTPKTREQIKQEFMKTRWPAGNINLTQNDIESIDAEVDAIFQKGQQG